MCTAIALKTKDFYFGRNLDFGYSFNEGVIICPRNHVFPFRHLDSISIHQAMIGMGIVQDDFPLFFDAVNESGVAIAGLNFPESYKSYAPINGKKNVAQFEFIPYLLSKATNLEDTRRILKDLSISKDDFSQDLTESKLHWMISDKTGSIVVESTSKGLMVYDNPVHVLTNEPEFPFQLFNLNNYRKISPKDPENTFVKETNLPIYCKGLGGIGLPGDMSSMSRFVKATFIRSNAISFEEEDESVNRFMHILDSVFQVKGCIIYDGDEYEHTVYSSVMNTQKGLYYYKTYTNSRINCINMHKTDIDKKELSFYQLRQKEDVFLQN